MLHIAAVRGLLSLAEWLSIWIGYFILVGRRLLDSTDGSSVSRFRRVAGLAAVAGFLSAGMFEFNFGDSEVAMMLYFAMALPFMADEKPRPAGG